MKPPHPVRLYPKSKQFAYELHAIFEEAGLEAECPDYPEILYWKDPITDTNGTGLGLTFCFK